MEDLTILGVSGRLQPMVDICSLSTVHYAYDNRIYHKQARSLAAAGFSVTVLARAEEDPPPDDTVDVQYLTSHRSRFARFASTLRLLGRAFRLRARVYVIHDPELLPLALALKLLRCCVVYDMHEDMPAQIGMKEWLPKWSRPFVAELYRHLERFALRRLDGLVLAETGYEPAYTHRHRATVLNYPTTRSHQAGAQDDSTHQVISASDDAPGQLPAQAPGQVIAYVGTLTGPRGLFTMLEVARQIKQDIPSVLFKLVGPINVPSEAERAHRFVADHDLHQIVQFTGRLAPVQAHAQLKDARVGLALLEPEPNYLHSLPTKLFEYMLAGVPVLCSNVPLWQQIVADSGCGFTVDPHDTTAIVSHLKQLLEDDQVWRRCRDHGLAAVHQQYTWESQAVHLINFYAAFVDPAALSTKV
jgi:glycosyltransferase involved in cell wall biosynthesis